MEYEAGAICRQLSDADGPAVIMSKIEGTEWPLAANVFGTRRRIAHALGTTEGEMLEHVAQRLKSRIEPVPFKGKNPRCQEVIIEGDKVDIQTLPFPLWNVGDGGRYITAGMFIARIRNSAGISRITGARFTDRAKSASAWRLNTICGLSPMISGRAAREPKRPT